MSWKAETPSSSSSTSKTSIGYVAGWDRVSETGADGVTPQNLFSPSKPCYPSPSDTPPVGLECHPWGLESGEMGLGFSLPGTLEQPSLGALTRVSLHFTGFWLHDEGGPAG